MCSHTWCQYPSSFWRWWKSSNLPHPWLVWSLRELALQGWVNWVREERTRLICVVITAQELADVVERLDHVDFVVAGASFWMAAGGAEGDERWQCDYKKSLNSHDSRMRCMTRVCWQVTSSSQRLSEYQQRKNVSNDIHPEVSECFALCIDNPSEKALILSKISRSRYMGLHCLLQVSVGKVGLEVGKRNRDACLQDLKAVCCLVQVMLQPGSKPL